MRRTFPAFLLLAAMTTGACAGSSSRSASPGASFAMSPGESVRLPDASTLRYVRVVADSRCPPDVQCIRAGDAELLFELAPAQGESRQVTVKLPQAPTAALGTWTLRVESLSFEAPQQATVRLEESTTR
jgi:hypothetical protein